MQWFLVECGCWLKLQSDDPPRACPGRLGFPIAAERLTPPALTRLRHRSPASAQRGPNRWRRADGGAQGSWQPEQPDRHHAERSSSDPASTSATTKECTVQPCHSTPLLVDSEGAEACMARWGAGSRQLESSQTAAVSDDNQAHSPRSTPVSAVRPNQPWDAIQNHEMKRGFQDC